MNPSNTAAAGAHLPHDPLDADEMDVAVEAVRADPRFAEGTWFSMVTLEDPPGRATEHTGRCARLVMVDRPDASLIEAVVELDGTATVSRWERIEAARPAIGMGESLIAIAALHENDDYRAALARRGITDLARVQIDPWPTGNFENPIEEGRRIARCISFYRAEPADNGYARPIEGLQALVDMARGEVLEVNDLGAVPIPEERGSYLPEDNEPLRPQPARLDITQPDGPGFTIDGHTIRWGHWSLHASLDPLEGLVLADVGYGEDGRIRPILRRASISEMVVPYGDPDPGHGWKNAFDVGEWGLGRLANSLTLGCDCLGEIRYMDAVVADESGSPNTMHNVVCIHEEDFGILWKHVDLFTGRTEVRRSRRLVVSSIATIGNYEYGFYWYFYLDGSIQLEVKLTGILSTKAIEPGTRDPYATTIAPGLAAPIHQHLFCARLDVSVDGPINEVHELDVISERHDHQPHVISEHNAAAAASGTTAASGRDTPRDHAFRAVSTHLDHELAAIRDVDTARSRTWAIVNPNVINSLGEPVAYRLSAGPTPTLLAAPDASVSRRAGFARHNLWVTPIDPDERRAAGNYPNQHPGDDGLPRWTRADRSLTDTEIVVWHTFGVTHLVRPEDWPVMPVEVCGFRLAPWGFFTANPALDLPPEPDHCH